MSDVQTWQEAIAEQRARSIDHETGEPFSDALAALWATTVDAEERTYVLVRADAPEKVQRAANQAYFAAINAFWLARGDEIAATMERRRTEAQEAKRVRLEAEADARLEAELRRGMDASVRRVVALLRREGPLARTGIESHRLPGVSKNSTATVLREAESRGLVTRHQIGRRVQWAVVSETSSPE